MFLSTRPSRRCLNFGRCRTTRSHDRILPEGTASRPILSCLLLALYHDCPPLTRPGTLRVSLSAFATDSHACWCVTHYSVDPANIRSVWQRVGRTVHSREYDRARNPRNRRNGYLAGPWRTLIRSRVWTPLTHWCRNTTVLAPDATLPVAYGCVITLFRDVILRYRTAALSETSPDA